MDDNARQTDEPVRLAIEEGIARLTLNRPDRFNALSKAMLDRLEEILASLARDPDLRVVVISANGRAFSAGHDLREMAAERDIDAYRALFAQCSRVMMAVNRLEVPVIAAVQGIATAAGCQLVAACDLAIASEEARFAVSGINLGLFCSTPSVALTRNVPPKRAFDMLVTGDFIDASTAASVGLVNEVVPAVALAEAVEAKARAIAAKNPAAIRHGKALFYRQRSLPLGEAYAVASEVMAENMMDEDTREAISAFVEKRKPARAG